MINQPQELTKALYESDNCTVEVSKSLYWHFMEVLPPVRFGTDYFVFQEGDGEILHFSKTIGDHYSCALRRGMLHTDDWNLMVFINRDNLFQSFKVYDAFSQTEGIAEIVAADLIGKTFPNVKEISQAVGVPLH